MKPGSTVFPPRSIFRTPDPARFITSTFFPTAKNLPRDIATACATGSAGFIVTMWPLCKMRSGFSCSKGKSEKAAIEPMNSRRVVPSVVKSFVKSRGSLRMLRCRSANVNAVHKQALNRRGGFADYSTVTPGKPVKCASEVINSAWWACAVA